MARKCLPNVAIANEPDWDGSMFVQDNIDPNNIVIDDLDLGCGTARRPGTPTPSLEGYWDRDSDTGTLYPKVLADMVMVGKTAASYDETFGVVGKIYSTGGYMMGPGTQLIYASDSTTMGIYVQDRNSLYIQRGHLRGAQTNAPMINTLGATNSPDTPPYTFYGDTETGMYRHENNGLSFSGGGDDLLVLNRVGTIQLPSLPATAADANVPVLARNASTGLIEQRVLAELHTHANMGVLNLLSDISGELAYDGVLVFNSGNYYTRTVIDGLHVTMQADIDNRSLLSHNHNLADLTEHSYNSLVDTPDLSDLHAHSNKPTLDRIPNYVGAGVEEGDIMERRGAGIAWTDSINPNSIQFRLDHTPPVEAEGLVWWNTEEHTLNLATGLGPVIQVGQEFLFLVYNDTGSTLYDGKVVYAPGPSTGGLPHVEYAKADSHLTLVGALGVLTNDIPPGGHGYATTQGKVRGIDNHLLSIGYVYVSADTAGELTNTKPQFPNYAIEMGGSSKIGTTDGEYTVLQSSVVHDSITNFWNGTFRESISFTVSSTGGVITGALAPTNGNVDMTMIFSDGFSVLDTSPPATIVLTAGTDSVPQMNYVYVLQSTKALTVSISGWPATEHIRVAQLFLRSAVTTEDEDALKNQNWNDHIQSSEDNMGHLAHIGQKLRKFEAQWESGTEGTCIIETGETPDGVYFTVTGGSIFQFHPQPFPAFDTQASDNFHILNHFTTPYLTQQNLGLQTIDAAGGSLGNSSFAVVLWGVANRSGEKSQLMINMPTGTYGSGHPEHALADPDNHSVYTVSDDFAGVGFLIARFIYVTSAGTNNWSLYATEDLRGKIPNTSAGGGSIGGAGVTTYLGLTDTDNTYSGASLKHARVNVGETAMEFVDPLTFENGLTEAAGVIKLGGDLTGATTITNTVSGTYALSLGTGGNYLSDFALNATGISIMSRNNSHISLWSGTGFIQLQANTRFNNGLILGTQVAVGSTYDLAAYDTDGTAYTDFIRFTAGPTPTMTFPQSGGGTLNFLNADGGWTVPAGGSGTFIGDTDTPADWTGGVAGYMVMVDSTPDALEFINPGAYPLNNFSGTLSNLFTITPTNEFIISSAVGTGSFHIQTAHTSVGSTNITMYDGQEIFMTAYTNTDWTGYYSIIIAAQQQARMAVEFAVNDVKSFSITAASMLITDEEDSIGLQYAADYSSAGKTLGARWIPDWASVTTQLGGNNVHTTITNPTGTEDGYVVYWDDGNSRYDLKAPGGGGNHTLLSATHTDTANIAVARGAIIYGDSSTQWNRRTISGTATHLLRTNSTDLYWGAFNFADLGTSAHAASHISSGGDAISLFAIDSTVSGLVPGSDSATADYYLDATGAWSVPAGGGVTPAALTRTNDTNVTLTLGGTPATALLQATSLTLGWSGTLADERIASYVAWNAKSDITMDGSTSNGVVTYGGPDNIDVESNLTFHPTSGLTTNYIGIGIASSGTYGLYSIHAATPGWFVRNMAAASDGVPYASFALELKTTSDAPNTGPFMYFKYQATGDSSTIYNTAAFGSMRDGTTGYHDFQIYVYSANDRKKRFSLKGSGASGISLDFSLYGDGASSDIRQDFVQDTTAKTSMGWDDSANGFVIDVGSGGFTAIPDFVAKAGGCTMLINSALATDHTASGTIALGDVDTNAWGVGAALHMKSDGDYTQADADTSSMPCSAIALESGTGAGKKILLTGYIRDNSWNWTPGGIIYVSDTPTALGGLTQTVPTDSGDFVQAVGIAVTADSMYFNPDFAMVEIV